MKKRNNFVKNRFLKEKSKWPIKTFKTFKVKKQATV